ASEGNRACRASMISCHTGAAPVTPLTSCIASPSKLPTHTPTVNERENPMHQLSRISLLVPVFTALQKGVFNELSRPNVTERAARSLRMSATMNAGASCSSVRSSTEEATDGVVTRIDETRPPRASERYACTCSHRLTSADPSAREYP